MNTKSKRNRWVSVAAITAAITSTLTLIYLFLIWFVWRLPETLGGWEGIKINPFSLIDISILFLCAIGVWLQRIWFARILVLYQLIGFITLLLNYKSNSPLGLGISLAALLLYTKALFSLNESLKKNE